MAIFNYFIMAIFKIFKMKTGTAGNPKPLLCLSSCGFFFQLGGMAIYFFGPMYYIYFLISPYQSNIPYFIPSCRILQTFRLVRYTRKVFIFFSLPSLLFHFKAGFSCQGSTLRYASRLHLDTALIILLWPFLKFLK